MDVEVLKQELVKCFGDFIDRITREVVQTKQGSGSLLASLELRLRDGMRPLQEKMLERILELGGKGYKGSSIPCECGKGNAEYKGDLEAGVLTICGRVRIKRAYYYHPVCQKGMFPLDNAFGIEQGHLSPGIRRIIATTGSEMSYDKASELLYELSGIAISDKSIEKTTELVGRALREEQIRERTEQMIAVGSKLSGPERIYMEVDGGRVHTRDSAGNGWREVNPHTNALVSGVKLGCVFEGLKGEGQDERAEGRYFGGIHDNLEEFKREWEQEGQVADVPRAKEVIAICDGADWIWKHVQENYPQAIQILDFWHALEHAGKVARAVFGEGEAEGKDWITEVAEKLRKGLLNEVLDELKKWVKGSKAYSQIVKQTISYYEKNAHRMEYAKYIRRGYFIGSGVIESACRHISNHRLKIPGARWNKDKANDVLRIRIFKSNRTWNTYWQKYLRKKAA